MIRPSLDIGVDRTVAFVVLVRVTPLGPVFIVTERSLEALVDLLAGSLDGSATCAFALSLPFSPGATVSGGGTGTGAGTTDPVVAGMASEGTDSDESCFSGCRSDIVGTTSAGSGPSTKVEGIIGYGSAGIGGSMETDLELAGRWEGGVGDLEGKGNGSGLGCGGIRCEGCLVSPGIIFSFDGDGGSGCGCGCGCCRGAGGSRFIGSVAVSSLGGREEIGGNGCLDKPGEPNGVRGDMGSGSDRVFCTGAFGSTSGSRLNGSSFRVSELEATTNTGWE